jgi:ribosome-associated protein
MGISRMRVRGEQLCAYRELSAPRKGILASMAKKTKFQWEADSGLPRDTPPPPRERSKKKREAKAVEDLMDRLLELPPAELKAMPIGADVLEGLADLRRLKAMASKGGYRRKRLRVAGLLRGEDLDAVRAAMPEGGNISPRELILQQAERWRERLLAGGDPALEELITRHPEVDRQRLRQLVRQANKGSAQPGERSPKSSRELFSVLRELLE